MSALKRFVDFECYSASIAHADLRMRVLGMERQGYSLLQAQLGRLSVQWAEEGSGLLSEGAIDRSSYALFMQLNERPVLLNGMKLGPNAIAVLPPNSEFCFSFGHANGWLAIRIPTRLLCSLGETSEETMLSSVSVLFPRKDVMFALRSSVIDYLEFTQAQSQDSQLGTISKLLEAQILDTTRQLCSVSSRFRYQPVALETTSQRRHAEIARAGFGMIQGSLDGPMRVSEIARSLGVSERTFLTAFRSHFDLTPRRFIQAMRLNRARALLRSSNRQDTYVQEIAVQCGFRDVGRFAAKYRTLFGELPKQTIKRSKNELA